MSRNCHKLSLIITLILLCLGNISIAQPPSDGYDQQIHLIYNLSEYNKPDTKAWQINPVIDGYIFKLSLNQDSLIVTETKRQPDFDFGIICDSLYNYCQQDTAKIFTLFFDYDFDTSLLEDYLKQKNIYKHIWQDEVSNEWPTVNELTKRKTPFVCFQYNDSTNNSTSLRFLWEHASQIEYTESITPDITNQISKGKVQNRLLYLTYYQEAQKKGIFTLEDNKPIINQNPQFISSGVDIWKASGKKINFLVINKFSANVRELKYRLSHHVTIEGSVTYDRKPLDNVFWSGSFNALSHGKYNFPAARGEEIFLKPNYPGYRFIPEQVKNDGLYANHLQNFIAVPLNTQHKIAVYFPFTSEIKDEGIHNYNVENTGCKIVNDSKRGEVAMLDGSSFITLPEANKIGISNSDFTVSAWINISENADRVQQDLSILGTNDNYYRGGLHLVIRNLSPYFGFFSNDLSGSTKLNQGKWYHIVWRYTKFNQEQAIFVNGKKDCSSLNHPAFISNSNILIGSSLNRNGYFQGLIDDLIIWSRPLGENEIQNLYLDKHYNKEFNLLQFLNKNKIWIGIALIIIITFLLVSISNKKRKCKRETSINVLNLDLNTTIQSSNYIQLFGNFKVIDDAGKDITDKFTPRLKKIFIYLILKSDTNTNGIQSEEFLSDIWPEFERKKAINNRGVSISKLRSILEAMDSVKIVNHHDRWSIELKENVYCDYYHCINKLEGNLFANTETLNAFLSIVQQGAFLQDSTDACFDLIKGNFSNKVIDILTKLLINFHSKESAKLTVQIADRIFIADDLNEDALKYKVKALLQLGQINQSKFLYKTFCKRYTDTYQEPYSVKYKDLT